MQHLLSIEQLSLSQIESLIESAINLQQSQAFPSYQHSVAATLFFENSTRTRLSFELAAKKLSMQTLDLAISTSSVNKGETLIDTVQTVEAMGAQILIVRHQSQGVMLQLSEVVKPSTHIVNAGEGKLAHPSQALLDLMTIYQHKQRFDGLKVVIMGDVLHSRVANSLQHALHKVGAEQIVQLAPPVWQLKQGFYTSITQSAEEALDEADVIVCLRVQNERIAADESLNSDDYQAQYQLNTARLALAKDDAVVLHPGPVNWGVEIAAELSTHERAAILQQVNNGVYMRMAILDKLLSNYQ